MIVRHTMRDIFMVRDWPYVDCASGQMNLNMIEWPRTLHAVLGSTLWFSYCGGHTTAPSEKLGPGCQYLH